jgi:hypothetical protein
MVPFLAACRHDATTASSHNACAAPKTRSARPASPPPVISSTPNQATRASSTATAPADTPGRRPHGTDGPRRQAPAGQATTPAHPTAAQIMCGTGKLVPGCSGFAATSMPATAPAIKISRPGTRAGRRARPVAKTQAPTTTNVSDITHRSAAPTAASALTGSATGSNERGCSPAAMLHPATVSTGAAADETTPHQGTPCTVYQRSWWHRTSADDGPSSHLGRIAFAPLGLRISEAKTGIAHMSEALDFPGFRIQWRRKRGTSKWYACTFIADRPIRPVKDKIRALTRRTSHHPPSAALIRLNQITRGWANYFKHAVCKHTLESLEIDTAAARSRGPRLLHNHARRKRPRRARCRETGTAGSASGLGKRTGSNPGTAPKADSPTTDRRARPIRTGG